VLNLNKRLFVEFDDDMNVICVCNADAKNCSGETNCDEYFVKFTPVGNIGKRKISQSPRRFNDKRTLTGELKPSTVREHNKGKIENLLKKG
jgi:hypothetical protein